MDAEREWMQHRCGKQWRKPYREEVQSTALVWWLWSNLLVVITPVSRVIYGRRTSPCNIVFSARCNIYISRLCDDVSVRLSVRVSVTEVHWRIIANLGFTFRSHFTAHCGRRAACWRIISRHARLSCNCLGYLWWWGNMAYCNLYDVVKR